MPSSFRSDIIAAHNPERGQPGSTEGNKENEVVLLFVSLVCFCSDFSGVSGASGFGRGGTGPGGISSSGASPHLRMLDAIDVFFHRFVASNSLFLCRFNQVF
jgi:hypothetical protein